MITRMSDTFPAVGLLQPGQCPPGWSPREWLADLKRRLDGVDDRAAAAKDELRRHIRAMNDRVESENAG